MADESANKRGLEQNVEDISTGPRLQETTANGPETTRPSRSLSHEDEKLAAPNESVDLEKIQSEPPPPPVKVTLSQRRGLLARLALLAEVTEPKHYARPTKYFITFIIALAGMAAPIGSTVVLPSLLEIAEDLHSTASITNLSVAFYMLAMSIFPLWWSSFSETFGRRSIYIVSFALFLVFNILAALSVNISMFIIFRLLGGGAAASVQAVGAGTIADIWEVRERGKAMGLFYLGPLMGPLFGPILGGALAQSLRWRSTLWFLAIYGGVMLALLIFVLPETLKAATTRRPEPTRATSSNSRSLSRTTTRQSVSETTSRLTFLAKRYFLDPLRIILYLRYPAVAITVYYASITFGSLYLLNISIETTFSVSPYSFSTLIVGLAYIPASIGYILASFFGGRWTDIIMAREARRAGRFDERGKLIYRPEDRMRENAWIAAILYPGALIWYGWTVQKGVHWAAPLIASFFFGVGSMLVFAMATTMLTEFMPRKASAGVAVNNFVRNLFSCIGAIVAQPLISAIGNGWLFTGVGVIAAMSSIVVWLMKRYGPSWRERMVRELN